MSPPVVEWIKAMVCVEIVYPMLTGIFVDGKIVCVCGGGAGIVA